MSILEVDESTVLGPILRSSIEFSKFYKEERLKKLGVITWYKDNDLVEGSAAQADSLNCAIYFEKFPESIADTYVMAHEIMHLIRDEETTLLEIRLNEPKYCELVIALTSMLEDPIIDSILQKRYNFDLLSYYISSIDSVENHRGNEPKSDLSIIYSGLRLGNTILRWSLIKDQDALKRWNDFLARYKSHYPRVYKVGCDIADIVKSIGLDPIENHKLIASQIIDKYELNNILFVTR